jgi:hypothetical protein
MLLSLLSCCMRLGLEVQDKPQLQALLEQNLVGQLARLIPE